MVCSQAETPLVESLLISQGFVFEPEPFSPWCFKLLHEPFSLGASAAGRFGLLYIQDRSSMLPPLALAPQPGDAVLDMCASPGGKTSFLAQLTGPSGFVLGNEPSQDRLTTLRQNLHRMNMAQAATCSYKGEQLPLPDEAWSSILLDPPCSGWGTVEKNPQVLTLWKPEKVEPLITLQRQLLTKAARLLAPGGRLLYSTCTTNPAENEEQAAWAAETLGLSILPLTPFPGFRFHEATRADAAGTLRVDGHGSEAQGFYLALLTKPPQSGDSGENSPYSPASGDGSPGWIQASGHGQHLAPPDCYGKISASGHSGQHVSFDHNGQRTHAARQGKAARSGQEQPTSCALHIEPLPDDAGLAWENLPPGGLMEHRDKLYFLPARAAGLLPPVCRGWRLGGRKGGRVRPWARARVLVPALGSIPAVDVDDPARLTALLSGQSMVVAEKSGSMGLYFNGLPLGFLTVKNGRALWSDR